MRLPHPDTISKWEATEEVVAVFSDVEEPGPEDWPPEPEIPVDDDGLPL